MIMIFQTAATIACILVLVFMFMFVYSCFRLRLFFLLLPDGLDERFILINRRWRRGEGANPPRHDKLLKLVCFGMEMDTGGIDWHDDIQTLRSIIDILITISIIIYNGDVFVEGCSCQSFFVFVRKCRRQQRGG